MTNLKTLQETIGYTFKDKALLIQALTHKSAHAKNSELDDYERLEFLGDRILGLVIAEMLLQEFDEEPVGAIAKRHSALVRGQTLVKIADQFDLALYIKRDHSEQQVRDSILEDVCEALIAALYRDSGMEVARQFIEKYWRPHLRSALSPPQDPKSRLQEWAQGCGLDLPIYTIEKQSGPDHYPDFKVSAYLEGYDKVYARARSKKEAEKIAAEKLYEVIQSNG